MKAEKRTKNLMYLLGWQGGTVHDACREVGLDPHEFLYSDAEFDYYGPYAEYGPCPDFRRGYAEADDIALYLAANRGNLQYWFGAIAWANNHREDA